jgi:hypothetical protein
VTPRQAYAAQNPLLPGAMAVDRRLWRIVRDEVRLASALAVVRSAADGVPSWHACVGRLNQVGILIPLVDAAGGDRRAAVRSAEMLLRDVGIPGLDQWTETEHLVHLRRPMNAIDLDALPSAWISLPFDPRP